MKTTVKEPKKENVEAYAEESATVASGWDDASHDVLKFPNFNVDRDFVIAKSYLQKIGCRNETTWDHLNDIINHVLSERPPDCLRYFEETSRELRIKKFFLLKDCEDQQFREVKTRPQEVDDAKILLRFYRHVECLYESENPYEDKFAKVDFFPMFKLLEEAGVGMSCTESYHVQMAMRRLYKVAPVAKLKFWGKIFGTIKDYYIVETELDPEAMEKRLKKFQAKLYKQSELISEKQKPSKIDPLHSIILEEMEEEMAEEEEEDEITIPKTKLQMYVRPPLPVAEPTEEVVVPTEEPGTGVNRKVYYVTNDPIEEFKELPDLTPKQIVASRTFHKYLTGILSSTVESVPVFPGTEASLLRAQIARITAGTHSSPIGFYTAGGEEEEAQMEEGQIYMENADYEPPRIVDLLDGTLEFWVHHEPHILKQGRVTFWKSPNAIDEGAEEFAEDEEEIEVETGPAILSSLSSDSRLGVTPAWIIRRSTALMDDDGTTVVLRSSRWPGAITITKDRYFVNFYTGFGKKHQIPSFDPYISYKIEKEYELGPEIMEMTDPSVELEEFLWQKLHPKKFPMEFGEGEGGNEADEQENIS